MVSINNPHTGKSYEFTFGADPELFVTKGGKLVSAHGLIKGDKQNPLVVKNGAVQVDGMALEFNIDAATNFEHFDKNLTSVMTTLQKMVPDYEFMIQPVAEFGADYISSQPKEARELGCEPDFNAYTKTVNPRPAGDAPFRTASGHLHIGWTKGVDPNDPTHFEACCALVRSLDLYVGIPSLVWDESLAGPAADKRRALYGKAGAFRPKPYGLEYRVLSNIWITDRVYRKTVYENSILAIKHTFADWEKAGLAKFPADTDGDKAAANLTAREIVNKEPGWYSAAIYAMEYGGVKSSRYYRDTAKKAA